MYIQFSIHSLLTTETNIWSIIFRLLVGFIVGSAVGIRQEKRGRPAGLRTHIIISIGATIAMIASLYVNERFSAGDPARIAAQVVSGVGFLGAGTIIKNNYANIVGLTTAASIWTTAILGLAIGLAMYELVLLGTFIVLITLTLMRFVENTIFIKNKQKFSKILIILNTIEEVHKHFNKIKEIFKNNEIIITNLSLSTKKSDNISLINISIIRPFNMDIFHIIDKINSLDKVTEIKIKNA